MKKAEEKEKDHFAAQQGKMSFVKAKMDWAAIDKIHLSFVKHTGQPTCSPVSHIEAALSVGGATGALYLSQLVISGVASQKRKISLAKTADERKANPGKTVYPQPFFESFGGTAAKGKETLFRAVSLAPGMATDYVLQAKEGAGEITNTGGIQMKKGAKETRISVGFSSAELLAFAVAIQIEWTAYRAATQTREGPPQRYAPATTSTDTTTAKEESKMPKAVYIVYDSIGISMEVAISPAAAIVEFRKLVAEIQKLPEQYAFADKEAYKALGTAIVTAVQNDCDEIPTMTFVGNKGVTATIVILRKDVK
ncbi:MAG: hypothetical protein RR415_06105 [Ruthenibacterium sp.]